MHFIKQINPSLHTLYGDFLVGTLSVKGRGDTFYWFQVMLESDKINKCVMHYASRAVVWITDTSILIIREFLGLQK